ncbi:DUF481 domain-containing protein [Luteimonas sp. SDU101]|uniref:DUF481 domain-containing protein n=1 Tax=Luteimonas sp. SDU101 TaxID=3422593 RepID=UPI003EBBFCC8
MNLFPIRPLATLLLTCASLPALAAEADAVDAVDAVDVAEGWTGTGELGFALSRGNARSESLNTRLAFTREDARWQHRLHAAALRARSESSGDFDGDGIEDQRYALSANRFELGGSSGYRFDPRHSLVGSLRYEHDDFSAWEQQATASLNYGRLMVDNERTRLSGEIGPGLRRARSAETGESVGDAILRARAELSHRLTGNTQLLNTLLVESGADNTFAQNDLAISVAMSDKLALKAGLQTRHNTEVDEAAGVRRTDTLTTLNLVYSFR